MALDAVPIPPARWRLRAWAAASAAQGIRAEVAPACATRSRAWRLERRGRPRGIPVLLSLRAEDGGRVVVGARADEARAAQAELRGITQLGRLLARSDERLRRSAQERWRTHVEGGGALVHLCAVCAETQPGYLVGVRYPVESGKCRCGASGVPLRLVADRRRIY